MACIPFGSSLQVGIRMADPSLAYLVLQPRGELQVMDPAYLQCGGKETRFNPVCSIQRFPFSFLGGNETSLGLHYSIRLL